jgi:hypothetical protein
LNLSRNIVLRQHIVSPSFLLLLGRSKQQYGGTMDCSLLLHLGLIENVAVLNSWNLFVFFLLRSVKNAYFS